MQVLSFSKVCSTDPSKCSYFVGYECDGDDVDIISVQHVSTSLMTYIDRRPVSHKGVAQPLLKLEGYENIIHASYSQSIHGEYSLVCYTTRVMRNDVPHYYLMVGAFHTKPSVNYVLPAPMDILQRSEANQKNYVVGYFMRSSKRLPESAELIVATDRSWEGIYVVNISIQRKQRRFEVVSSGNWRFAAHQVWHQWDPKRQRLAFFCHVAQGSVLRIVQLCGNAEERHNLLEVFARDLDFFVPTLTKEMSVPWASGQATSAEGMNIIILPITYEYATIDFALCEQLIDTSGTSDVLVFRITLLRNQLASLKVQTTSDLARERAVFLFVCGMIVVHLEGAAGGETHFIDVSHRDRPLLYLFCERIEPTTAQKPRLLVTLPSGEATAYVPGTCDLYDVGIRSSALWEFIRTHVKDHFADALRALHVLMVHKLPLEKHPAEYLLNLLKQSPHSVSATLMTHFLLGDVYSRVRDWCSSSNKEPFWACLPLDARESMMQRDNDGSLTLSSPAKNVWTIQHALNEWLLSEDIPRRTSLWTRLRSIVKNSNVKLERISLTEGVVAQRAQGSFREAFFKLLTNSEIPPPDAKCLADRYEMQIKTESICLLKTLAEKSERPIDRASHLLKSCVCLHNLNYPVDELKEDVNIALLKVLPRALVLRALRSGVLAQSTWAKVGVVCDGKFVVPEWSPRPPEHKPYLTPQEYQRYLELNIAVESRCKKDSREQQSQLLMMDPFCLPMLYRHKLRVYTSVPTYPPAAYLLSTEAGIPSTSHLSEDLQSLLSRFMSGLY